MQVSGMPLVEQAGLKRWGHDPAYLAYLKRTNRLLPWPPAARMPAAITEQPTKPQDAEAEAL